MLLPLLCADVLGVVLNKVPKKEHAVITSQLAKKLTAAGGWAALQQRTKLTLAPRHAMQ